MACGTAPPAPDKDRRPRRSQSQDDEAHRADAGAHWHSPPAARGRWGAGQACSRHGTSIMLHSKTTDTPTACGMTNMIIAPEDANATNQSHQATQAAGNTLQIV